MSDSRCPRAAAAAASGPVSARDMVDAPDEGGAWPELWPLLRACTELSRAWSAWDRDAMRKQRRHSILVVLTGALALAALLLALGQLSDYLGGMAETAEVIIVLCVLAAVALGLAATWDRRWRLRRFQAEQCRLLKFGMLLDSPRWVADPNITEEFLSRRVALLAHCGTDDPKAWVLRERTDLDPPRSVSASLSPEMLKQVCEYFLRKRIRYQCNYFKEQHSRRESYERWTRDFPAWAFLLGLIAALVRFVWEKAYHLNANGAAGGHDPVARVLLILVIALPIIGAAIRTFRGAFEFGRNANRFHALHLYLSSRENDLQAARERGDAAAALRAMRDVEQELEVEHRSWMRLMVEAEWFG